jgi:exodeoxyribonuclease VIII
MTITKEYLQERPLSFSSLKQFIKSPQHYIQYLTQDKKPTESMIIGSLIHNMLLEPDGFDSKFIIEPDINKRTNQGKEDYQKFLESVADKKLQVVEPKTFIKAKEIVTQVMYSPTYNYIKQMTEKEVRFDKYYDGIPICGYVDGMDPVYNFEIKTTSSSDIDDIRRDFYNLKYYLQAAMYQWYNGKKMIYIVIETSAPYLSRVFVASDSYMKEGHKLFEKAMTDFSYCLSMDQFDMGYEFYGGSDLNALDLPAWAKKTTDDMAT